MPKASRSDIEIAQRACVMSGISKIDTFEDASNEVSIVLNDMYEDIILDCLTVHPWRFANDTVVLGPQLATKPVVEFNAAYAMPNDPPPLIIHTVFVGGTIASKYRIKGEQIHLDAGVNDEVAIEALWRKNEAQWPPWFTLYAILRVAGFLTGAITRNGQLAAALSAEGERQFVRCRTRDSQQQTTQKLRMTKIRSARLGGRPL